jgi:Winged helix DNA-binding domain
MLLARRAVGAADALEHLVGMQGQEPQAPYLGLWSRLRRFKPLELSELIATRRAVRGALMRSTIHLVTARDWGRLRPLMSLVLARDFRGSPFSKSLADADLDKVVAFGTKLLAEQPRTRAELSPLLAAYWPDADSASLAYAVTYLEPIIQVPPRGLWRQSGQARWTTAAVWLGQASEPPASLSDLVPRYLAAFGPATVRDIQAWCGLRGLSGIIDRLRPALRTFVDEQGRELLDVQDAPLPDPDTPAPPRFLPPFDNAILAHADRSRIIDREHRQAVQRDRLMRTFLVDGFVAGTWRLDGTSLRIKPIRPLGAAERRATEEEAQRLLAFLIPEASAPDVRFQP